MSLLNRIQKLNGWQRAWLLCSTLLLIFMILTFDDRTKYEKSISDYSDIRFVRSDQKFLIKQLDNPTCQDWISKWKKASSRQGFFDSLGNELAGGVESCSLVLNSIKDNDKVPSKVEIIKSLDNDARERLVNFIWRLLLWVVLSACLYGIGLTGRWIKRGG